MKTTTVIVILIIYALGIVLLISNSKFESEYGLIWIDVSTEGIIWFCVCSGIAAGIFIYKLIKSRKS